MAQHRQALLFLATVVSGCATAPKPDDVAIRLPAVENVALDASETTLVPAVFQQENVVSERVVQAANQTPAVFSAVPEVLSGAENDPITLNGILDVDRLASEVVARNPSVQSMIAAWQAAAQRYPQVFALDDPMLDMSVGPGSWGSPHVDSAYMVMASQKIPWPGKRQLRGEMADAEASAAANEIENVQLRLAEAAKLAFYDYVAANHELALNAQNTRETRDFRDTAESKLRANLVTQQDVLQADVELALLERRQNELERQVIVAAARINTLLHRDALYPLPPPPERIDELSDVPAIDELRQLAIQRRPDLMALAAEIQAGEAALDLAWREFYPDLQVYGKYDAFWQEDPLRTSVGLNVNVPLNKWRRYAAVREAQARLQQRRAEYERLVDDISNEIESSYARLVESRRTANLFRDTIIPTAQKNVDSARAGYVAARVDFLRLIEAERQLIMLREQLVETLADYHRHLAALERAAAVPIDSTE